MLPTGSENAVPFGVPARFLLTGAAALAAACTALALRPSLLLGGYTQSAILAVVHTLTLGCATMILVGALHQLMPVLLVTRLHAPQLGGLSYGMLLPGVAGVVAGFALGYRAVLLAAGGSLVLAALLVLDYNLWRTAATAKRCDAVGRAMLASAGYLTLTATLGMLVALSHVVPSLARGLGYVTPLHLGLGLFGAFFLAIAGAGHKLLGMFVLAHGTSLARLRALVGLVHGALGVLAVHTFTGFVLWPAGVLVFAAVTLFVLDLRGVLAARLRRTLELPMRQFLLASGFLVLALPLGALGYVPAAVCSFLGGFVVMAVAGMLVKVSSFLAWQHRYAARVGKEKVPMLRDMYSEGLSRVSLWGLGLGALVVTVTLVWPTAVLAAAGCWSLAVGAWGLLIHLGWIVFGRHQAHATDLQAGVA